MTIQTFVIPDTHELRSNAKNLRHSGHACVAKQYMLDPESRRVTKSRGFKYCLDLRLPVPQRVRGGDEERCSTVGWISECKRA